MSQRLAPKLVVAVERETGGTYLAQLECGHVLVFVAPTDIGDPRYCSVCLNEWLKEQRKAALG